MGFVKANVIYDCLESIQYDDQNSSQSSHEGKDGIGYQRPENSKPSWLKNRLDKDKAKAGSKSYVKHQPWRNSRNAKSGWRNTQPRRDLYGQHIKSKLNRSHCNYAQTLKDTYTGKTVKGPGPGDGRCSGILSFIQFKKLSNLDALRELKEHEKLMLEWAETDSLEMAVKRKAYIVAKYRELLLRKFLDYHRKYFSPGQPWTATASMIIDLLSDAHSKSLEDLLAQQQEHSIPMEQPCASTMFDSSIDSGVVLVE
ncbi:zinc-metallopeptidase, peroxisomal-like [Dorcoceras hygrometricum]|uniref:Zinc-metallopeptidase, peroxisomal-like n=1 Tax=Dorcoceras hygrometricum TaxID=472368 RepID=A0A2Z7BYB1_9LAMI|nr:zinc-metallopeptidase, peroxisomal-like [Dorcoceras hygrometricum]